MQKDPFSEKINYHDGFRKAHRNTLTWSSILLLCAIMKGENGEVGFLFSNARFPIWVLLILIMIVSIFMFVSFIRAKGQLDSLNSKLIRENSEADLVNSLSEWRDHAVSKIAAIDDIDKELLIEEGKISRRLSQLQKLYDDADHVGEEFHSLSMNQMANFNGHLSDISDPMQYSDLSDPDQAKKMHGKLRTLREIHSNTIERVGGLVKEMNKFKDEARSQIVSIGYEIANYRKNSLKNRDNIKNEFKDLFVFARKMSSLYSGISTSEKIYYIILDNLIIYIAFFVSLAFALARLFILSH